MTGSRFFVLRIATLSAALLALAAGSGLAEPARGAPNRSAPARTNSYRPGNSGYRPGNSGYRPGNYSSYRPGYNGYRSGYNSGYRPGYYSGYRGYDRDFHLGYYGRYSGLYYPGYFSGLGYYPYSSASVYYVPSYSSDTYLYSGPSLSAYTAPLDTSDLGPALPPSEPTLQVQPPAPAGPTPPAAAPTDGAASVSVIVPPDAEVFFNGSPTRQKGGQREFVTPVLPAGQAFQYDVRARWTDNGLTLDQSRTVTVHANERINVDFTATAGPETIGPPK